MSGADRKAKHDAARKALERRQCENPKRRARLEKSTPDWLMHYLGSNTYPAKWSDGHLEIIHNAEVAALSGTGAAVAAPRGEGKTTVLRGVAVNLVARGIVRFPVLVGWKHRDAKVALRLWLNLLSESKPLQADYPELTQPFEVARHSLALRSLTWNDTGQSVGAMLDSVDNYLVLPDSRGAIAARSAQGDAKGLNAPLPDGTILRPDLLLLDDAQDPKRAESIVAVEQTIDTLENVFMGMAGPQKRLTTFGACTVEAEGDVSCHLLNREGWKSARISRIKKWPGGGVGGDWPMKPEHAVRQMWDEWREILLTQGQKKANTYFRKHRKKMTVGMQVSWSERYEKGKDVCALDAAMWDYYNMGADVFSRAQQNLPIKREAQLYDITPEIVCKHVGVLRRRELPEQSTVFGGHVDINRAGLHWCLAGFEQNMTGHSPAYGKHPAGSASLWPRNAPELVRQQAIFTGLKELCDQIAQTVFMRGGQRVQPSIILIDRGYEPRVVHRFCSQAAYQFRVIPARGYAAHKYVVRRQTLVGRPYENCHMVKSDWGPFLAFSADAWRETAQRAFLAEVGAPGGFTLFREGGAKFHMPFAEHICAEKLANKYETDAGMRWEWRQLPGSSWDWGDAYTGCWVAAAAAGLSAGGVPFEHKKKKAAFFVGKGKRR